ncbi:MAG: right-handed parallel beta-helix repeat-containing protein [Deltaproteobacteria bacterium]|nr:right-handed parallel beta-helix repeat-containing protein [Deltaproteobacteria bacterium]
MSAAKAGGKALVVMKGPEAVFGATYPGPGKLAVVGQGGARISSGAGIGLQVSGGDLYARGLTISGGTKQGISISSNAKLQLESSRIQNNEGGGVLVDGGTLVLTNSTISGNGPGDLAGILWGGIRLTNPTAATRLDRVSVLNNNAPGISCSGAVQGTGVLATGNSTANVSMSCGFTSCATASATCGAP